MMEAQPSEAVMSSDFSSKPADAAGTTPTPATLDRGTSTTVCEVIDNRTSLVPRHFSDQPFLRRRAYSRALERARKAAIALNLDRKI
jgi:hypothetical protein